MLKEYKFFDPFSEEVFTLFLTETVFNSIYYKSGKKTSAWKDGLPLLSKSVIENILDESIDDQRRYPN